jgi:hypothetical protein
MLGITILGHETELIDILRLLGSRGEDSQWDLEDVEAVGESAADELHHLSAVKQRVAGKDLLRLAREVVQIVDAQFSAYEDGADHPWIIIRAIDSSAYDVLADNQEVLDRIRRSFRSVVDAPDYS